MKKIVWIPALLLLFFIGDRVGSWMLKSALDRSQFRYSRMYNEAAAADILLLGNSRGLIFYQPHIEEITGKSTLNLSYNGMAMDLGRALVDDYLDAYSAPELLLIDVSMCDRENDQLLNGFNCYSPYSENINALLKRKSETTYYAGALTHLYRYNSEVFQRAMVYLNKSDEDWLLDRVINDFMVDNVANEKGLDFTFAEADFDEAYILKQLNQTVQAAKAKGTKVALVVSPYYPAFFAQAKGYEAWLQKVEKATGMQVADYSTLLTERAAFGDYQHLNKAGAKAYLDQLKKDGLLN